MFCSVQPFSLGVVFKGESSRGVDIYYGNFFRTEPSVRSEGRVNWRGNNPWTENKYGCDHYQKHLFKSQIICKSHTDIGANCPSYLNLIHPPWIAFSGKRTTLAQMRYTIWVSCSISFPSVFSMLWLTPKQGLNHLHMAAGDHQGWIELKTFLVGSIFLRIGISVFECIFATKKSILLPQISLTEGGETVFKQPGGHNVCVFFFVTN